MVTCHPDVSTAVCDTSYVICMQRETMACISGEPNHMKTCLTTQCLPTVITTMENNHYPPEGHNTMASNRMHLLILHGLTASKHEDLLLAYPSRLQEQPSRTRQNYNPRSNVFHRGRIYGCKRCG
ncbi:hypothetical protein ACHAXN_000248 [Cyclotella atomus]